MSIEPVGTRDKLVVAKPVSGIRRPELPTVGPDTKAAAQFLKESSSFCQRSRCSTPNRLASRLKSRPSARSAPIWSAVADSTLLFWRGLENLSYALESGLGVLILSSLKSSAKGSHATAFKPRIGKLAVSQDFGQFNSWIFLFVRSMVACSPGTDYHLRMFDYSRPYRSHRWIAPSLLLFVLCCTAEPPPEPPEAGQPTLVKSQIQVGEFVFEALAAGPQDGELVLLLHGFPQTGYAYRHQLPVLAEAGFRAVAPDQRGYSPGARPEGVSNYALSLVVQDVVGIADALGHEQFHLVGHDWGGAAAWVAATQFPQRVLSLTVFSTPHFAAFGVELANPDSDQSKRSAYFSVFGAEGAEDRFLENAAALLRGLYSGGQTETGSPWSLGADEIKRYIDVLGQPAAMRAALNWYRALNQSRSTASTGAAPPPPPPIQVPTLYVWSDQDSAFGIDAATATEEYVSGPYQFEILKGIGHWIPEQAADQVNPLLLAHLGKKH